MGLDKYVNKRDFTKTAEPKGGASLEKDKLVFVIQKHDASRLHYDFRLEMEGVLKSWAVPKGPSTDPKVKRLAVMVEDHPYSYRDFEGIIPKGQYGGGTVIVWDEGTYAPAFAKGKSKKAHQAQLLEQLNNGHITFVLNGTKLKGEFVLIRSKTRGENQWLLMKVKGKDAFDSTEDITLKDQSVKSGLTIEQMASSEHHRVYGATEAPTKMPLHIKPMLATLVDSPFDDPDWFFEIKWDGYRALTYVQKGEVNMVSRNNKPFNEKFYPLHDAFGSLSYDVIFDGEVVVLNADGRSDFGALQNWRSEADGDLVYYIFDILWHNGRNLMETPLRDRKALLNTLVLPENDQIRIGPSVDEKGIEFFSAAEKLNLEGIIAKHGSSLYTPDLRSKEWLKVKAKKRQEVVIGGYTRNEDTVKAFSALLLGVYEDGALQYVGKVGTGFNEKQQKDMMTQFKALITKKSPFVAEPNYNKPSRFRPDPPHADAVWLTPTLVCEVSFTEVTSDGVFRHPSFQGMRMDKTAKEVKRETALAAATLVEIGTTTSSPKKKKIAKTLLTAPKERGRKSLLNPTDETQVRSLEGHELTFTHLSKVFWPADGFTKRDLFNYYYQVSEYILPYLKDRPQSLNRFPNGIEGQSFYQKNVKDKAPEWITTFPYETNHHEEKEFLVITGEASLQWAISQGCIEVNPWFSRVQSPEHPDYCVIDLDPDKNTFEQVIEAAQEVKKVLVALDVPSFPKTSGSTGMHIYIPLGAKYSYDQAQLFAKLVVTTVHQRLPEYTSLERMVANRHGKMYLDFLQNRPGATIAGPYSVRPKPGATVSMPLHWDEVKPGLAMKDFTIETSIARLKREGDLFKGVLGKGIDLAKVIGKAEELANA